MQKIRRRLAKIAHAFAKQGFPLAPHDRRLAALEGKFEGDRAVIIGTGPSLRIEDLERLAGWKTFACNKIYLAFENTSWRPDFYSICDIMIAEQCSKANLEDFFSDSIIINHIVTKEAFKNNLPILYYDYASDVSICNWNPGNEIRPPISFVDGLLTGGYSVMIEQLQMSYLMGFSEVAIIGADLSYFGGTRTGETSRSGDLIRYEGHEAEANYFHKDYYQPGAITTVPNIDKMKHAWEYCRQLFESSGRTLVNASRQSALECVQRVDFDCLFPKY